MRRCIADVLTEVLEVVNGSPTLDVSAYRARRQSRFERCRAAAQDPQALGALLRGFAPELPPTLLGACLEGFDPHLFEGLHPLAHWVWGDVDGACAKGKSLKEIQWDQSHLSGAPDGKAYGEALSVSDGPRLVALYALARLGEEYASREIDAWRTKPWAEDPQDGAAGDAWQALFDPKRLFEGVESFKALFGERVRRSFVGLGVSIRLPREVCESYGDQAVEMLDLLPAGMHLDVATRVVEGRSDPLRGLGGLVPGEWVPELEACIARRAFWTQGYASVHGRGHGISGDGLEASAGVAALLALRRSFETGQVKRHSLGLPGWGIIRANRGRMRGRLRAFLARDPQVVSEALLSTPQLFSRTAAAVSRHAWAWAWREARRGFSFDVDGMGSPRCAADELTGRLVRPIEASVHPGVRTFLLLVLARGQWPSLRGWVEGAPSNALSKSFYRCLKSLPDDLADPQEPGQRVRRYSRLREHLMEVGLEGYGPPLLEAATLVQHLKPGRSLSKGIQGALGSLWDVEGIPFPRRGLPTLLEELSLLQGDPARLAPFESEEA